MVYHDIQMLLLPCFELKIVFPYFCITLGGLWVYIEGKIKGSCYKMSYRFSDNLCHVNINIVKLLDNLYQGYM